MNNKGFTIIEVMVAIFVFTVSVIGFFQVSFFVISKINSADYRVTAINIAASGIEKVRGIRDEYIRRNLNNGWCNHDEGVDSFCELIGNKKEFILDEEDLLIPLEDTAKLNWEKVYEEGNLKYLRKISIEDFEKLKKITVSVDYDDGLYSDTVSFSTFLGDISIKK